MQITLLLHHIVESQQNQSNSPSSKLRSSQNDCHTHHSLHLTSPFHALPDFWVQIHGGGYIDLLVWIRETTSFGGVTIWLPRGPVRGIVWATSSPMKGDASAKVNSVEPEPGDAIAAHGGLREVSG